MTSRDAMIAQIRRCAQHQNEQIPAPEGIPFASEGIPGEGECLPEEPMGAGQPIVPCDVEVPSAIFDNRPPTVTTYDGSWA